MAVAEGVGGTKGVAMGAATGASKGMMPQLQQPTDALPAAKMHAENGGGRYFKLLHTKAFVAITGTKGGALAAACVYGGSTRICHANDSCIKGVDVQRKLFVLQKRDAKAADVATTKAGCICTCKRFIQKVVALANAPFAYRDVVATTVAASLGGSITPGMRQLL